MGMKKNSNKLSTWLERIFSIQTFSLLVAIVGVYYGIKSFLHNEESNITLEIYNPITEKYINIDGVSIIWIVYKPFSEDQEELEFVDDDEKCPVFVPIFRNITEKSLKNFKCEITYEDIDVEENEDYINNNYEILDADNDDVDYDLLLKYKYDVLHAQSELPTPLTSWDFSVDEELVSEYKISYDGLSKPMLVCHILSIDDGKAEYTLDQWAEGLEKCIYPDLFSSKFKARDNGYVIIFTDGLHEFKVKKGIIKANSKSDYKSEGELLDEEIAKRNKQLGDSLYGPRE